MRTLISAAALALVLTACGGGDEAGKPAETVTVTSTPTYLGDPTTAETSTPPANPDPFAPNVGDRALRVGRPRVGESVTTVLLETDLGISRADRIPDEGNQFLGLRISTCVRDDADMSTGDYTSTYPGEWYAVTESGDEYTTSSSYNDWPSPKYSEGVTMPAGACLKGWIAIEVPKDIKGLKKVVYRPGGTTVAEWLLRR